MPDQQRWHAQNEKLFFLAPVLPADLRAQSVPRWQKFLASGAPGGSLRQWARCWLGERASVPRTRPRRHHPLGILGGEKEGGRVGGGMLISQFRVAASQPTLFSTISTFCSGVGTAKTRTLAILVGSRLVLVVAETSKTTISQPEPRPPPPPLPQLPPHPRYNNTI